MQNDELPFGRCKWCEVTGQHGANGGIWRDRSFAFCRSQHPPIKIWQAPHSSYKVCLRNLILVNYMHLFFQHSRCWTTRSWGSRKCLYSGRYGGLWCMDATPFATLEIDIWTDWCRQTGADRQQQQWKQCEVYWACAERKLCCQESGRD